MFVASSACFVRDRNQIIELSRPACRAARESGARHHSRDGERDPVTPAQPLPPPAGRRIE